MTFLCTKGYMTPSHSVSRPVHGGQNRGVFASKLMAACGCDVMGAEAALPSTWDGGTANAAGCEYVFGNQVSPSAY